MLKVDKVSVSFIQRNGEASDTKDTCAVEMDVLGLNISVILSWEDIVDIILPEIMGRRIWFPPCRRG